MDIYTQDQEESVDRLVETRPRSAFKRIHRNKGPFVNEPVVTISTEGLAFLNSYAKKYINPDGKTRFVSLYTDLNNQILIVPSSNEGDFALGIQGTVYMRRALKEMGYDVRSLKGKKLPASLARMEGRGDQAMVVYEPVPEDDPGSHIPVLAVKTPARSRRREQSY